MQNNQGEIPSKLCQALIINNNVIIETPQHSEAVHNFNRINKLDLIH